MIRIDAVWLAVQPVDLRSGAERLLAQVVQVFGAARSHHGYPNVTFTFLGFRFRPRKALGRQGRRFASFLPGVSGVALTRMRQTVKRWRLSQEGNRLQPEELDSAHAQPA